MSEEVEQRLDEFSKALATRHSRRGTLKLGVGLVAAAVASVVTGRTAQARPIFELGDGSDECAHACSALFPPPRHSNERARCLAICKAQCERDPTRICAMGGDPIRCCPSGSVCCGTTACCQPGENCCPAQNRCVTCTPPRIFNPATCGCDCPVGTTPCGPVNCCPPGFVCSGGVCQPAFCPTPGLSCAFTPCPPGCRCVAVGKFGNRVCMT
jgi:hypothetical protein